MVVGYVPTETGFSAVIEAERQARWEECLDRYRQRGRGRGILSPTAADEPDLDAVGSYLTANGVPNTRRAIASTREHPQEILLRTAHEVDASLIVLGLHHRSWIAKRMLGSTARSVVLAAPCPVLVVPDADRRSDQPVTADVETPALRSMGQTPPWTPQEPNH